jgi:hypothetical protein
VGVRGTAVGEWSAQPYTACDERSIDAVRARVLDDPCVQRWMRRRMDRPVCDCFTGAGPRRHARAFALTLPGRAPVTLVSLFTALGLPVVHVAAHSPVGFDVVVVLIPALIGAVGGRVRGRLLATTASRLASEPVQPDLAWNERPLSTRFLLAVGIVAIAAGGLPVVVVSLNAAGHPSVGHWRLTAAPSASDNPIAATPMIKCASRTVQ